MTRVVYLHVGAPKTGTTYFQDRLTRNARSLARNGVHLPTGSPLVSPALFHFRAALDLLGQDWGGPPGHARGAWDTLVRRVGRMDGTVVVSHEILAPAAPDRAAQAVRELGEGAELHVVYSARDLARQLPAAWQESIKQGRKWTYRRFLRLAQAQRTWFSRSFDLPSVLATWGADLPPDRVHVVTVPAPGSAPRDELWLRFCAALDIDPSWAPRDSDQANRSLGMAETQLIRRLNRRLDRATRREASFDALIRGMLAQDELVRRSSPPVRLPPELQPWVAEQADRWIDWVKDAGVHVVGDLDDLRPVPPSADEPWRDPDRVRARPQLRAALDALAAMTTEAARRPDPDGRVTARLREAAGRWRER